MKAGNIEYNKALDLPDALAVIITDSILILPHTYVPLIIHQAKYIKLVEDALKADNLLGALQLNPASTPKTPYNMGSIARITSFSEIGDGKLSIALEGICRFYCEKKLTTNNPYDSFIIKPIIEDFASETLSSDPDKAQLNIQILLREYLNSLNLDELELEKELAKFTNIPSETLINSLCVSAGFDTAEQQMLLEANTINERMHLFSALNQRKIMRQQGLQPKDLQ